MKNKERSDKRKKGKALKITLISILMLIVLLGASLFGFIMSKLSSIDKVDINKGNIGVTDDALAKNKKKGVKNIALFGVDSRSADLEMPSRSDTIIVASLNSKEKTIKLSSIVRDTYVDIPGRGLDKITHAYAFGGPELAVKTLNDNFDLGIDNFVTINFAGLANIIDELGGVKVEVEPKEVQYINENLVEVAQQQGKEPVYLNNSGNVTLNGMQAVGFCRIRSTAGGDFVRSDRQRIVLEAIMKEILSLNPIDAVNKASSFTKYAKTSLSNTDILGVGMDVMGLNISKFDDERFPSASYSQGQNINGVYYYTTDLDRTKEDLHNFIYENIKPQ